MTEYVTELKLAATAVLGACTALWGWFGWLVILWLCCLLLDYVTGSLVAASLGNWSSKAARKGIWHKLGCIVAVAASAAADLLLAMVMEHMPGVELGYSALLCPMVVIWYTLTELGSILENAVSLGAPVPDFLKRALAMLRERSDQASGK